MDRAGLPSETARSVYSIFFRPEFCRTVLGNGMFKIFAELKQIQQLQFLQPILLYPLHRCRPVQTDCIRRAYPLYDVKCRVKLQNLPTGPKWPEAFSRICTLDAFSEHLNLKTAIHSIWSCATCLSNARIRDNSRAWISSPKRRIHGHILNASKTRIPDSLELPPDLNPIRSIPESFGNPNNIEVTVVPGLFSSRRNFIKSCFS